MASLNKDRGDKIDKIVPVSCSTKERERWRRIFGKGEFSHVVRIMMNAEARAREAGTSLIRVENIHFLDQQSR